MNALRGAYLALFFANAIFSALFKSLGEDTLEKFGTFHECDQSKNPSCRGNQMIFRASFCVAVFFLVQTVFSAIYHAKEPCRAFLILCFVEMPIYLGLLIGSFFIPTSFFDGYKYFSQVVSGIFILFQIFSIVDFSYQIRDLMLDRIEKSSAEQQTSPDRKSTLWAVFWKVAFLGFCLAALVGAGSGIGYLYDTYGSCGVGVAFTTVTVVCTFIFLALCISSWLNVGLLPPCIVAVYLVLMCWQALTSNPDGDCQSSGASTLASSESPNAIAYNAIIGAFSITWTSWRTSSAASAMLSKDKAKSPMSAKPAATKATTAAPTTGEFSVVVVAQDDGSVDGQAATDAAASTDAVSASSEMLPESWQFYMMMSLAGVYMAMVLTDWDSADGSSNGVSMWVKIVAQWLTMLLFLWTLVAPKLLPDRDFASPA